MADQDPDDPQLKSLRAVWLAMRDHDEDPPDSGLSALMAAARSQATLMTVKPPWWKRVLDQLRRPSVLALASLLVVIGGAMLITKHDALEKAPTSAPVQQRELPATNLDIGGGAPAATATPSAPDPRLQPDSASKDKQLAPAPTPPVHRSPTSHSSAGHASPAPVTNEPAFEAGTATGAKTVAPESQKRPSAKDDGAPPAQVLVDQLATQARRAAQRGDCENAKAIATRIAGQDASYYRDHVAGDLSKCVTAPAAPGAPAADAAAH
jgi:hypothetical protein